VLTTWAGPDQHLVQYPVRRGELVSITAIARAVHRADHRRPVASDAAELQRAFTSWHGHVQQLLAPLEVCERWPLSQREPLHSWAMGRVTLLGDACHPMLPFLQQGAAMAIEDAWILARLLEDAEEDVPAALAEYQLYRAPRLRRLGDETHRYAAQLHAATKWARFKRNARLGIASRLLPELLAAQSDWLYGYDAVKGFS